MLSSQIYKIDIKIYTIENEKYYYYKILAKIGVQFSPNILKVLFNNNNHYSLLVPSENKNNDNLEYQKNNSLGKLNIKSLTHKIDALNINIEKLCILENNPTFYDDIKSYLKSVKAATDSNNKID